MDFLFDINPKTTFSEDFNELSEGKTSSFKLCAGKKVFRNNIYYFQNRIFFVLGDLLSPNYGSCSNPSIVESINLHYSRKEVYKLKGFFYLVVFDKELYTIEVFSSFLNILPVYYKCEPERIIISSSIKCLLHSLKVYPEINDSFIVEKLLFNYSFLNNTPFKDISLMPTCNNILINKLGIKVIPYYKITDLIQSSPKKWKNELDRLSDIIIREMQQYIPDEEFALTLTGGFDGRTIMAISSTQKTPFQTFSYGSKSEPDILVPEMVCKTLGLNHKAFILDDDYASSQFWVHGMEVVAKTEGAANISRAHYIYTASELSKHYKVLLTGDFGSEIIRSLKDPGVLASETIFSLFSSANKVDFINSVKRNPILRLLKNELINKVLDKILEEAWEYKESLPQKMTDNKKFYLYIIGEVFRKYFGPEIIIQSDYLVNRSPFLDYEVIKALMETDLSGVYSDFRELNPFKRYHGQILYSHILRKTFPPLLYLNLDRDYKPADFLSFSGKFRIVIGYINRKLFKRSDKMTPAYSVAYYSMNKGKIGVLIENSQTLNKAYLNRLLETDEWRTVQHDFANVLSTEIFLQTI